ncbi:MAG: class I SAM-dependent methyltransferase [Actinobacteria bacterium]|nr:class I SAM-dependent methyltransferase [Actinomycetota bacterium]
MGDVGDEGFGDRIDALDLRLFDAIESQTSPHDKRSLLAVQRATRRLTGGYRYLEIGSHLGGSIAPHLVDPCCTAITSIDKRPPSQPDERGVAFAYEGNSTARMLALLGSVGPTDKVATIDAGAPDVDVAALGPAHQLCFIDGEHTDRAVVADFELCLAAVGDAGAIAFHDAPITYRGIAACLERVTDRDPVAYALPDAVFVVELGGFALHDDPYVADALLHNHRAYLAALLANDHYREFANGRPFRLARQAKARVRSLAARGRLGPG